jgi:hypothetical protein
MIGYDYFISLPAETWRQVNPVPSNDPAYFVIDGTDDLEAFLDLLPRAAALAACRRRG